MLVGLSKRPAQSFAMGTDLVSRGVAALVLPWVWVDYSTGSQGVNSQNLAKGASHKAVRVWAA